MKKDKMTSKPLFLGGPLLGSSPGCCGLRGSSLGDTARLGLSQNLGLLNDSRGLECSSVPGRSRGVDGRNIRKSTYGSGGLASLARVSLGLGGSSLLARSLLRSGSLGSLCNSLLGISLLGISLLRTSLLGIGLLGIGLLRIGLLGIGLLGIGLLGTSRLGGLISQLAGTIESTSSMKAYLSRGLGGGLHGRLRSGLDRSLLLRKLQRARWA